MRANKLVAFYIISLITSPPATGEMFFSLDMLKPKKEKVSSSISQTSKPKNKLPKFKLTGIVEGKEKLAIINGTIVKVSDKINGCTVKEIQPQKETVVLECNGYIINLTLVKFERREN